MNTDLQIQNKKLELIQWLSTIEDLNFLDKISDMISRERKKDWWDEISEAEKQSIEKGIAQADAGKLNPHSKARKIYGK
jgi:thiamine pyrophosphate-dependent acetolactate synthase large subunit-like protein